MRKTIGAVVAGSALLLGACGSSATDGTQVSTGIDQAAEQTAGSPGDLASVDVGDAAAGAVENAVGNVPLTGNLRSVLLDKTLDPANELSSARFEGRLEFVGAEGSDMPGEISIVFSGAYDLNDEASEISMDLSGIVDAMAASEDGGAEAAFMAGFFAEPMQIITIGDQSWMKWSLFSMFTGSDDSWIEGDGGDLGESADITGFGGGSPVDMLESLADANATIEVIGTEDIRGVTTTHYRALVDPEALIDSMSAEEQAELETNLGAVPAGEFPMELWLDEDGLVHRYLIDLSDPAAFGGEEGAEDIESATFTFDMWDHGADLDISPPPADQVLSEEDLNFGFGIEDET